MDHGTSRNEAKIQDDSRIPTNKRVMTMKFYSRFLPNRISQYSLTAWFVLFISLSISLAGWYLTKMAVTRSLVTQFELHTERLESTIVNRMHAYIQLLRSATALFAASQEVSREEWHQFIAQLHLDQNYPGLTGIGFSSYLLPKDLVAHIDKVRAEGFPTYTIEPQGKRDEYTAITYMEPMSHYNKPAFGYDMFSQPDRRVAMERARDTGEVALSAKVVLVQDIAKQNFLPGSVMYVPIYRNAQPQTNLLERRHALMGYVYVAFHIEDVMRNIFGPHDRVGINFEIFDGTHLDLDTFMYRHFKEYSLPLFIKVYPINIAGHFWSIRFSTLPEFEGKHYICYIILLGGMIISILLFSLVHSKMYLKKEIEERQWSENRFQDLVLSTSDLVWEVMYQEKDQCSITYISEKIFDVLGYRPEEMLGKMPLEFMNFAERKQAVMEMIPLIRKRQAFINLEREFLHKNGQTLSFEMNAVPMLSKAGQLIGYRGTNKNITSRKRAEKALRESEQRFRSYFELPLVGIAIISAQQTFIDCNDKLCQILGYSKDELKWLSWFEITHPEDVSSEMVCFRNLADKRDEYSLDKRFIRKDETVIYSSISARCVRSLEGKIDYFVVLVNDVTDKKQAEEALYDKERFLRLVIDNIPQMIFWKDINSVYLGGNKYFAQVLQLDEVEKIVGKTDDELIWTNQAPWFQTVDRQVMETDTPIYQMIEEFYQEEGLQRWVKTNKIPLHDLHGQVIGILGTSEDVTLQVQAEHMLKQYNRKLEQEVSERTRALLEKEALLRLVIDTLPQYIFWKDTEGIYLGCNKAFAYQVAQLDHSKDVAGKKDSNFWWEEQARYYYDIEQQVITTGIAEYHFTEQIVYPTGEVKWVETNRIPLHNEIGQVVGILGTAEDITLRKQAQETLQETHKRFSTLLESFEAGVYVADMQTYEVLFANHYIKRMVHNEHIVGQICWKVLHQDQSGPCPFCTNQQLINDQGFPTETYIWEFQNTLTGQWFHIQNRAIQWTDGRIVRLEIATDITRQKHVEDALRKSEERFKLAMRGANEGLWDWNLETNEVYYSPRWKSMLGFADDEINHHLEETLTRLHPEDVPKVMEVVNAYIRKKLLVYEISFRMRHKQGHYLWILSRAFGLWNDAGKLYRLVGTHEDITKQKQAEVELHSALVELSQFKFTLDMALDYIAIHDAESKRFIYANQGAMKQTGYSLEEFLTMTPSDVNPTVTEKDIHEMSNSLRNHIIPFLRFETYHQHKCGRLVPVELSLQYVETEGMKGCIIAFARDITERKQTEGLLMEAKEIAETARVQAERANRAKSTFLANMSHELRTPLNGILGYTQILARDRSLNNAQLEGVQIIQRSGEYLLTLINDVLDLSKIEAGKIELYPTDFHFREFMLGIVDLFRMRAEQKGIFFAYEAEPHLPIGIHSDEKRLRQVLINLLGNAVKFTEQGGVTFKVGYQQTSVSEIRSVPKIFFEIIDTGVGIASENVEKIFSPFQQVGEQKYRSEGTGLGLSITKRLIEMMGGKLHVESILGQGSRFLISLELLEVSSLTESMKTEHSKIIGYWPGACPQERYKILIVDDTWENRLVMVNLLSPLGFEIIEASNGQESIEKALEFMPDIIFMDLVMPVMDGLEATRQMRNIAELEKMIIIAASASVFDFHQQESLLAGCNDFIPKPFYVDQLFELLQKYLKLKWIYEEDHVLQKEEGFSNEVWIAPSSQQASALWNLAKQGDILGILEQIKIWEENDKQIRPFAMQVRQLANNFEDDKICQIVEKYIEVT